MKEDSGAKKTILFIAATAVLIASVLIKENPQRTPRPRQIETSGATLRAALTVKLSGWSERNDGRRMAVFDITNPRDEDASIWPPNVAVLGKGGWMTNTTETGAYFGTVRVNAGETIQYEFPAPMGADDWRVFFASSHKKSGVGGMVDRATDKAELLKGQRNERFLGEATLTESPILKTPSPPETIAIFDLGRTQNDKGWPHAKLLVTNRTSIGALVDERAIKRIDRAGWHTNYNLSARVSVAFASMNSLSPGEGFIAEVPFPKQTNDTWKLEMVVFPKRTGVGGLVDKASEFKSGTELNSFMGDSYYIESPPLRR